MPSEKEVRLAERIVEAYINSSDKGIGAFDVDGKVVDMPVFKAALRTLSNAGKSI